MPEPTSQDYQIPNFDSTLPDAPTYAPNYQGAGYTPPVGYTNPYSEGTNQYNVSQNYLTQLGRAPESDYVVQQWATNPNYASGIAGSPEAQTLGRARNEINPLIDSQLRGIYDTIGTERQRSQSQLEALRPAYDAQFGALNFGRNEQTSALDALRAQVLQDTDYNSQQLQSKFLPAQQNAFNAANRRGLLDSTVSLGLLNQGFEPIQRGLTDLYRSSQRQLSDAEQKRQGILQKYGFDFQNLVGKREQEAKALRDQMALITAQKQNEATQVGSMRNAQIYARSGELGDASAQRTMAQRQLDELIRFQTQQSQLARDQFNQQVALANKK